MALTIHSRQTWGARYASAYRNRNASLPAREVWLHHTAMRAPAANASLEQDIAAMRAIEQVGQDRFGSGISYSLIVMPSGRVFEGHRIDGVGAHTGGRNSIARAISLHGNYDVAPPTPQQLDALAQLLVHGHRSGWWASPSLAGGHRDAPKASTACPGKLTHGLIPEINRRAARLLTTPPSTSSQAVSSRPTLQEGATGPLVTALQTWLNRMYPSYSQIDLRPKRYGPQTVEVVTEWQRRSGLTPDGRVGPASWREADRQGFRP